MTDATKRQLFIDDEIIESTVRLTRRFHPPHYDYGPVLQAEHPWEGAGVVEPVVHRDQATGRFRMWYRGYGMGTSRFPPYGWSKLDAMARGVRKIDNGCYAESDDGVHWTKPQLGLVEWRGSKANNLVPVMGARIEDPLDPAPARRYKIFNCGPNEEQRALMETRGRPVHEGHYVTFSADGHGGGEPALILPGCGDAHSFMYDPRLDRPWVCFTRPPGYWQRHERRMVARLDSPDLIDWSPPRDVFVPDLGEDEDMQFYKMYAFPCGDGYLGYLLRLRSHCDRLDTELVWSRDSVTWRRDVRRAAFMSPGPPGSWNSSWVAMAHNPPVDVFGDLYLYYEGRNAAHIAITPGPRSAIGLAVMYEDRFASLSTAGVEGRVTTRPFTCPGGRLVINANAFATMGRDWASSPPAGCVTCEVLDDQGAVLPGLSRADCIEFRGNSPKGSDIGWKGWESLDSLKGRTIRLRFHLREADLYSFWFAVRL